MHLKRYDLDFHGQHGEDAFIGEDAEGAYVKFEDVERLFTVAKNAAAAIGAIYQWLERVEAAGGATSIAGVAACNAMLKSLRKNADRTEKLVMEPLREAVAKAEGRTS